MNDNLKIKKIKKKSAVIAVICIIVIAIPVLAMLKNLIIGPRYVNDSALLKEQVIYYKFNNYHYVSGADNVESGRCIKHGLFENLYLSKGSDDYIINSQLHERYVLKREDLIENIYRLYKSDNEITYHSNSSGGYLDINGEKYLFLDSVDRVSGLYFYESYVSCGTVDYNSKQLNVYLLKGDYQCDFVIVSDEYTFTDYIFTRAQVDMDAYNALDSELITAYAMRGLVNHKSFGNIRDNEEIVVNALKELKSSDAVPIGNVLEYRPPGEHLYFDLIYSDLPILHKDRINITVSDDTVYYNFDNSLDVYVISDEETAQVFKTIVDSLM